MNQSHKPLLFLDSNVLIEGLLADYATAKAIIIFARHKKVNLVTCEQVVTDIETELIEKTRIYNDFSTILQCWQEMQKKINLKVVPDPSKSDVITINTLYLPLMRHQADIPILTSALTINPRPDFILSGNRKHFNDKVSKRSGIPIYSCDEYVKKYFSVVSDWM